MSSLNFSQGSNCELVRAEHTNLNKLLATGRVKIDHYRGAERINSYEFPNGIVNEGKNYLLNAGFHGSTAWSTWYCGLIDLTGYSALAADDTYDDINQAGNGWDEFTSYTDANNSDSAVTRPVWSNDAASGQSITNSTTAIFDITANGTVKGVFIAGGTGGAVNKSDHAATNNILWATALFGSGDVAVLNGDQLKVTYTVSA